MSQDFVAQVSDAYDHLYDIVYLRHHALAGWLSPLEPTPKVRAWRLHHLLLDAIEEMDPGPNAPTFSREWRRHRLMVLRYIDGLDAQRAAERLACSRRTYYRELGEAMEAAAAVVQGKLASISPPPEPAGSSSPADRLELLRVEMAQMAQASRRAQLADVVAAAVRLTEPLARAREMAFVVDLAVEATQVAVDWNTVRQIILGAVGYLLNTLHRGQITVSVTAQQDGVVVAMQGSGAPYDQQEVEYGGLPSQLAMLQEMAASQGARLESMNEDPQATTFHLWLPCKRPYVVLVADDNEDTLHLLQCYLGRHGYQVVTTRTGDETLALARQLRPYAITLDLMMPDQDGWDVLQKLLNQAETHDIPVLVCSVLSARDLALSLGATRFLSKPVGEDVLISTLEALERQGWAP